MKWILLGLWLLALPVSAQAPTTPAEDKPPPALSEVQKLQIQNAAQALELWQLKVQQAASEYEKARDVIQKLIASVTPAGYQLNDKLEFVKMAPPPKGTP